jgi:hypothetical protein
MTRLLVILAVIGLAYWYWTGHQRGQVETSDTDQLQENAATMQRCINQEQRMQSVGGLAGVADVGSSGVDAERLCAEKNGLYKRDGGWYRKQD